MISPAFPSLDAARSAATACAGCALSEGRTHVVFGHGDPDAAVFLIGQGPSTTDDTTGRPYTGPAGDLLDRALDQAGLNRDGVWITNIHRCVAVRTPGGTEIRAPRAAEIRACRIWLDEEIAWVRPRVLVAIGGPAAKVLLGRDFKLTAQRGIWHTGPGDLPTLAVPQPTYLKRLSDHDRPAAVKGWRELVADLAAAAARAAV